MKAFRYILFTTLLLLIWACVKELPTGDDDAPGDCRVAFTLTSKPTLSLDTKASDPDLLDGSKFKNLLVILVDNNNIVKGNEYKEYVSATDSDLILFENLKPGNYTAYAYANIDAVEWQDSGSLISASGQEKNVALNSDFTPFLSHEMKTLSAAPSTPAAAGESSMLLTGKAAVPVGLAVETHPLYLQRPVVRFRVYINNTTPYPVTLEKLGFSYFNADKAYLIDHSDDSGVPAIPGSVTYSRLPAYPNIPVGSPAIQTVPGSGSPSWQEEYLVYETYLYENASPYPYKVFATLNMDLSPAVPSNKVLSLGQQGFGPVTYANLNSMSHGEEVDVLFINPRATFRSGRLYYGIGPDLINGQKYLAWESCGYKQFAQMTSRAMAVFEEDSHFRYQNSDTDKYKYNGYNSNSNGVVGWTGSSSETLFTTQNTDYYFDYTGARSTHLRTITKYVSGNDYSFTIDSLALSPITTATCIDGLKIEQGAIMGATNRYPANLSGNNLVRFIKNGQYLKSDNAWSAANLDAAKKCRLVLETDSTINDASQNKTTSDHQFLLMGNFSSGGALKRILKETNKEVPLNYMSRNEDIKLVLNVYYSDQEGVLTFRLDNSTWTTQIVSSHTFE